MIRESLTPGSRHATMVATPATWSAFKGGWSPATSVMRIKPRWEPGRTARSLLGAADAQRQQLCGLLVPGWLELDPARFGNHHHEFCLLGLLGLGRDRAYHQHSQSGVV